MSISSYILVLSFIPFFWFSTILIEANETLAKQTVTLHASSHVSYYQPQKKKVMNIIDSCWRSRLNWASNRQALADCARGFGSGALGGKNGAIYVVTDPSDDAVNPKPGTLRYGVIQDHPLWIVFKRDMVIKLENELMVSSYKTIDGRGAKVEITGGPCITIQEVSHVIVHGISIHDCKPGKHGMVRRAPKYLSKRQGCDGDAISIFASTNVWIDHCYLARSADGLVDITHASTAITVTNNYFTQHDKVMLLGHKDGFTADTIMKVTVAFNHFGPGLVQRMPRVRYGYAHVANNYYDHWLMYAIGGSSNPTILSEANYFIAPNNPYFKDGLYSDDWRYSNNEGPSYTLYEGGIEGDKKLEPMTSSVTKRDTPNGPSFWKNWKWRTSRDVFSNGAYFVPSGMGSCAPRYYGRQAFAVAPGSMTPALTSDAGPLPCLVNKAC